MYNDDSLLLDSGKYQFSFLKNVPAKYLLNIQKSTKDEELKIYIASNVEKLKERFENEKEKKLPQTLLKCKKISYQSEKEAMNEIMRIMKKSQDNKKPNRVYKCFCGAFHLTSKEFLDIE